MLLFVIGLSGRFAEWCDNLTLQLGQGALGQSEIVHANTLEEIARNLLQQGTSQGTVALRHPGGRVRRALAESGCPLVVGLDDPRAALADLFIGQGIGIVAATRRIASSCASVVSFSEAPGVLILRAEREGKDRLSMAAAVARHLQLDVSDGEIAEIVGRLDSEGSRILDPSEIAAWWESLDPGERAIASGALSPYLEHSTGLALSPITWAPELFFTGDRLEAPLAGGVDITGRARCLLRGPNIMLPPGVWSITLLVDVSPEAAEHSFVVEATAGATLTRTVIRPAGAGIIETELTLMLDDLPDRPLELLLSNERPAFGGHLTLLRVTLTPQPPAPDMLAGAADGTERVSDGSVASG